MLYAVCIRKKITGYACAWDEVDCIEAMMSDGNPRSHQQGPDSSN